VFEDQEGTNQGGYVENKATGVKIPITKEGSHGTYEVNVWTKRLKEEPGGPLENIEDEEELPEGTGSRSSTDTTFRRPA
jgi:hypothetical protein